MFVCSLRRVDIPVSHFAFFFPEVSSGVSGTSPLPLALDTFFVFFLFFPLFDFTLGWDCGVSLSSFSFRSPSNGFISSGYWVRGSDFTGMVFWFPSVNWDYGIGGGADGCPTFGFCDWTIELPGGMGIWGICGMEKELYIPTPYICCCGSHGSMYP